MSFESEPWSRFFGITFISCFFGGMILVGLTSIVSISIGINYAGHLLEILGANTEPPTSLFEILCLVIISIIHGLIIPSVRKEFFSASKFIFIGKS